MFTLDRFRADIQLLVNIDSGTHCREGVNKLGRWFADRFYRIGWDIDWFEPAPEYGKSFLAYSGDKNAFDLLILCHLDTVFPEGEAKGRPFSEDEARMYGPGVADMKSGCLFTWYAIKELLDKGQLSGNVAVFYNGEHEISCPHIRPVIEELSQKAKAVISAESARVNGAYVKQRKGIGRYRIEFHGKGAHAGNNPFEGECAITEAAHWTLFLREFCDQDKGIYVNPGIISGGMSQNSIPHFAELAIDTRFDALEEGERIERLIREKAERPFNPQIKVQVKGKIMRPPMVPNARTEELCSTIEKIGERHGVDVHWAFAGGGSDASFASPFGIPTLCGLAAVGGKLHSKDEYLEKSDLEERYKVFRDIVLELSTNNSADI